MPDAPEETLVLPIPAEDAVATARAMTKDDLVANMAYWETTWVACQATGDDQSAGYAWGLHTVLLDVFTERYPADVDQIMAGVRNRRDAREPAGAGQDKGLAGRLDGEDPPPA